MSRRNCCSAVLVLGCVVAIAMGQDPAKEGQDAPEVRIETEIAGLVEAHNAFRKEQGLGPLVVDPLLTAAARAHALDMARNRYMAHEGKDGSTPPQRVRRAGYPAQSTAENIARGFEDVAGVIDGWKNSPEHRTNMVGDFTQVGVARSYSHAGEQFWAVEFGRPWPSPDPEVAAGELLAAINAARREKSLPGLRIAARLNAAARRHSEENARRGALQAKDSDGLDPLERVERSGYRFRRLGMAGASGQPTAAEVLATWLEHETHRSSLFGGFTEAGIGYARAEDGKPFWTLILGTPRR
jgi:uncharacterized protein YkwD